jgi:glycosyltransferase involved in cell wall biosynthesis
MVLSIIIPSKNEEKYISGVITSILNSYIPYPYEIIVADNSTDDTVKIIKDLNPSIKVIKGGPTPVARNNGVKVSKGDYLLFIDSDIVIKDDKLIFKTLTSLMGGSDMVTTNLKCKNNKIVNLIYQINNIIQHISIFDKKPFSTGSFMGFNKDTFKELGGFDEKALHCEDYLLSKKVNPKNFKIINSCIYTDDRRFIKMGYFGMIRYFYNNIKKRNNDSYFYKDINYWG